MTDSYAVNRRGGSPFGDDDGSNQMSDSQEWQLIVLTAAFRSAQGLGQGANIPMTAASVPAEPMSDAEKWQLIVLT